MWEIYAQGKSPYEGENPREVMRQVCNPRINKRPPMLDRIPSKMVEMMKRCWHHNLSTRPEAKDLDTFFTDLNVRDAEPLNGKNSRNKKRSGDMLYEVFPKHIADALKAGEKVEPESHDMVTVVFSGKPKELDASHSYSQNLNDAVFF
jgi:Protein tyrosine and serine/threonine kinase